MAIKKISEMIISYNGKEYLLDLLGDGKAHYGKIHIDNEKIIEFERNQSKSIQSDFTEQMNKYFSKN